VCGKGAHSSFFGCASVRGGGVNTSDAYTAPYVGEGEEVRRLQNPAYEG
jgi:hypothetical protein